MKQKDISGHILCIKKIWNINKKYLFHSAVQLIVQFTTPYDHIKKNRTIINLAFLDAIKKERKIEIAYPHLQIVTKGKTKR